MPCASGRLHMMQRHPTHIMNMDFLLAVCIAGCRAPTVAPPDCCSLAAVALCKGLMSRQFSIIRTAMLWSKCHCRHSHASCRPRHASWPLCHASWLLCHASCLRCPSFVLSDLYIIASISWHSLPRHFHFTITLLNSFFLPSLCNLYIYMCLQTTTLHLFSFT